MDIKSLTIYCSSSNLLEQKYYDLANQIGEFLGNKENINYIWWWKGWYDGKNFSFCNEFTR